MADDRLPEKRTASLGLVVGVDRGESGRPSALVGNAGGVGTRPAGEGTRVLYMFSDSSPSRVVEFSSAIYSLVALSVHRRC